MNDIIDFFKSQWPGILAGISVGIILLMWKSVTKFIGNLPRIIYKRQLERNIEKTIDFANKEIGLTLLPSVQLKIVDQDLPPKELEDELVVFVKKEKKPFVFSNIIISVLEKSFLRDSRRHIPVSLYDSARFIMGRSLITHDCSNEALKDFEREALRYYERTMEDLLSNKDNIMSIEKQDLVLKKRLYKTVLLQELYALGERLIGVNPNIECKKESLDFVDFLHDIARKDEYFNEKGIEPPLSFIRDYISASLILVKKRGSSDISKHFRAIKINIKNGALSIYILGWGEHSKLIKSDFKDWLEQVAMRDYVGWRIEKIIELKLPKYHSGDRETPGVCCIFRHNSWIPM